MCIRDSCCSRSASTICASATLRPSVTSLALRVVRLPDRPGELVEPAAFPGTPEMWFWSVFIDQPGVVDAFNLYFGSAEVAGYADGRDNLYGAVRLVRNVQRRAAKK